MFHPGWEEKRKSDRILRISNARILDVFIRKGKPVYGAQYSVSDNLSQERYTPARVRQEFRTAYVNVSVVVSGRAEATYIAVNNHWKRAIGYEQTFEVKIAASDEKTNINVKARITDFMGEEVYDKKEYVVTIDSDGYVLGKNEIVEEITSEMIKLIAPTCSLNDINKHVNSLNQGMKENDIDSFLRKVHFISQLLHESGYLKYAKELGATENSYNGFFGRGLIQITGKGNYLAYQQFCEEDMTTTLQNRQKLEKPPHAALSAAWYWNKNNLNYYADKNDFIMITAKINGGFNGFEQRLSLLKQSINVLSQFYGKTIPTYYMFDSSAAYTNAIYCFAWGLWHDPDLNNNGCKKDRQEAIKGYRQMLELIPDDYGVKNKYGVDKMELFNELKDSKGNVLIAHAARKRLLDLSR